MHSFQTLSGCKNKYLFRDVFRVFVYGMFFITTHVMQTQALPDSTPKNLSTEKSGTHSSQEIKHQSPKASSKSLPPKKQNKNTAAVKAVEPKDGSAKANEFISNILMRLARTVPDILKAPMKKSEVILLFVKKNSGKVIVLLISFLTIVAAMFFFRQRYEKKRFMTTTRLSVMDKEVQRACRYIENNYYNVDLTVDLLCTVMVTGKAFLNALFEKELGLSVEDFIMQVRVNRVKITLNSDPTAEIEAITLKTGFSSGDALKKAFVKIAEVDIEEFRKSLATEQNVK